MRKASRDSGAAAAAFNRFTGRRSLSLSLSLSLRKVVDVCCRSYELRWGTTTGDGGGASGRTTFRGWSGQGKNGAETIRVGGRLWRQIGG